MKHYGSIPHLIGSRRGPSDRGVSESQHAMCCVQTKQKMDRVIVQEKLDGSCCAVLRADDSVVAVLRDGRLARKSPWPSHHMFTGWVQHNTDRFLELLHPGERAVGEWMAQAIGTRYDLPHGPFVVFDIMKGCVRVPVDEVMERAKAVGLPSPAMLHSGEAIPVNAALIALGEQGHHGASSVDRAEGCVWRVEREREVILVAKYVRHGKVDGVYFGDHTLWNTWQEDGDS